jgi:hypothetical protein
VAGEPPRDDTYTVESLRSKTNKALQEMLRARGLGVGGTKDQLMGRLMEHARRGRRAG